MGALVNEALDFILKEAKKLRSQEKVFVEPNTKSLRAHLKAADRGNYKKVLIAGEDELKKGEFFTKEL